MTMIKAREFWIERCVDGPDVVHAQKIIDGGIIHVREVLPGEVTMSREVLENVRSYVRSVGPPIRAEDPWKSRNELLTALDEALKGQN